MKLVRTCILYPIAFSSLVLASCGGGALHQIPQSDQSGSAQPPAQPPASGATVSAADGTYAIPLSGGYGATITLHAQNAPSGAHLLVHGDQTATAPSTARQTQSARSAACPIPPTIYLQNPFPFPITIRLESFSVVLPCDVDGTLFGVSFYQAIPQPAVVTSTKVGDATAMGRKISFRPAVTRLTFAPFTTSALAIRQETSTAQVVLPVAPGSTTMLTSNVSHVPSTLSFNYATATGGSSYSSACFNAHDASGALVAALRGVPIAGTPSFYCSVDPGTSAIAFGRVIKFFIGRPKYDASVFEFDGPSSAYLCTSGSSVQCDTPSFSIPTYRNLIVANAKDLQMCVPVTPNADCNNVAGKPSPPPSMQTVSRGAEFQLLVADDPTYKPGTRTAPVPWDGLLRLTVSGKCRINTRPDSENGETPPGYSDDDQRGVGPSAEFDISPTGSGTCSITTSEDPKFITDYSDPQHPTGRSKTIAITIR